MVFIVAYRTVQYLTAQKLVQVVVSVIIFSCSCHACTTQLSLPWDPKVKDTYSKPIYGSFFN